ncbi:hypothetical protein [Protofrankia coriariae]|uniref:hypothetical protein n=1 Tax=Protofrankia coriariae TaxID=1562887 RepID=UPI00064051B0|nr:hypothetical protein [Protofrankia coriariae]
MPSDPLVLVRRPRPDTIHLTVRPGADATSISAALTALPTDAFYVDHDGDPTYLLLIFRIPPVPPPSALLAPPAGWTPSTSNGTRPDSGAAEHPVRTTAGLPASRHNRDILRPPAPTTPD